MTPTGLAAARSTVWTTILSAAFDEAVRATARGDVAAARAWLLVREFRPPTRFSRAAADATLALDRLEQGVIATPAAAAAAVRADLLDTYDGRIRVALAGLGEAQQFGFAATRAELGAAVLGYWAILGPAYRAQRGAVAWRTTTAVLERLRAAAGSGSGVGASHSGWPTGGSRASERRRSRRRRRCVGRASSTGSSGSWRSSTVAGSATGA